MPTGSHSSLPPPPTIRESDELEREQQTSEWTTSYAGTVVHTNVPVSVSDLKFMRVLRLNFFSFHLTADEHFSIYPIAITGPLNMSILLEVEIVTNKLIRRDICSTKPQKDCQYIDQLFRLIFKPSRPNINTLL